MKSSVGFKSNLYPVGDPPFGWDFCTILRDPKALEMLKHEIDVYGLPKYHLSPQQNRLRHLAVPCIYSPKGDRPSGTETRDGPVICKCRQTACKLYHECMKGNQSDGNANP